MTPEEIDQLIGEKVAVAITAYETNRTNGGREGSDTVGEQKAVDQGCSYKEFMHYKPLYFNGNEGTIGLVRWFEKLESIFHISGCADDNRVKYATCTLLGDALTWWNVYTQSVGVDAAYETTWEDFRQKMAEDAKRKQDENKGKNVMQYTNKKRKMDETGNAVQNVKRGYVEKLPYCGSCDKHHTGHCAMICNQCRMIGHVTRECRNPTPVAKAIMTKNAKEGSADRKRYLGDHPYCNKCDRHHPGRCTVVCGTCKKIGHKAKNCRIAAPTPISVVPMTCYECGTAGHFKKNCPKLKEQTLKQPKEEPM